MPSWRNPGNEPVVDEYLRRQAMSADDYAAFIAGLKKKFPAQPFLIVRYGDHQPEFSPQLLDPDLDEAGHRQEARELRPALLRDLLRDRRHQFRAGEEPGRDGDDRRPYLPLVIQEAAGIPLDPSFEEQKKIMLRCKGLFYACKDGAEARRFNRLLIDAGARRPMCSRSSTRATSRRPRTSMPGKWCRSGAPWTPRWRNSWNSTIAALNSPDKAPKLPIRGRSA
jgi:hypothetical protein